MAAADAPPNSRAETREGTIRCVANSGGNEDDDSFRFLEIFKFDILMRAYIIHLRRDDLSASLPRAKLSSSPQTLTSRLVAKKPESAMPVSRNRFGVHRDLLFGFNMCLTTGNTAAGIAPRDAAVGGEWGGFDVAGG